MALKNMWDELLFQNHTFSLMESISVYLESIKN